ncbi:ferritin-like domain-containing protein [Haloferula sp. BvORR071]|uniref:ferritin-like domain-containing protein n=1 Tax=Haloferula sp. BvORR071 TaxID=1396141 RepID=UPI0006982CC5|nr:ferritin-like domain-containing protein [Haloferula sp. BvORR071]
MAKLTSLEVLLKEEIKDLFSAENQLVKALPKMAKAAANEDLKEGFTSHLEETKGHVTRLEKVAELLEISPKGKVCKAMQGLVEEGAEAIEEDGDPTIKDLALIAAAQRVEHYEISGYGSARALAETLGLDEVVELLQETLDEESECDSTLTDLAETLMAEANEGGEEEEEADEAESKAPKASKKAKTSK